MARVDLVKDDRFWPVFIHVFRIIYATINIERFLAKNANSAGIRDLGDLVISLFFVP